MATFEDGGLGDIDENEAFVRNIYPQLGIKRWWANNLGVYDESTANAGNRGTFLGAVYKNSFGGYDYRRTWIEIRKHIEEEMMYQLEGNTQERLTPVVRMRSKKAP